MVATPRTSLWRRQREKCRASRARRSPMSSALALIAGTEQPTTVLRCARMLVAVRGSPLGGEAGGCLRRPSACPIRQVSRGGGRAKGQGKRDTANQGHRFLPSKWQVGKTTPSQQGGWQRLSPPSARRVMVRPSSLRPRSRGGWFACAYLIAAPGMAGLKLCRSWTCHGEMIVECTTADSTEESWLTACSSSAHLSGRRPRSVDTTRGRYQSEHSDCQHQLLSHWNVCVRRLLSMATLIYQLHVMGTAWVEESVGISPPIIYFSADYSRRFRKVPWTLR
jgi:hypothetical protein